MGWVWHGSRRAVVGALALSMAIVLVPAVTAAARDRVPGIDVSKYQRKIDWRRVASANVRFAILRSSLGNSYVDTKYRRNVRGATRHGIVVGAYHFAKPNPGRLDARMEANHFLRVARNAPGDVVPVLDIESSGGLGPRQLWRWARRWLTHVERELGVRPMIYSGNYFWTRYMGNTSWFGREGYPHWVAHWYVRHPDVPGRDWAGRGWTFWQWSASGRVPGIRGPVDLDWFGGRDLLRGTIAEIRVLGAADGSIVGSQLSCGPGADGCRRLSSPGTTLTLRARPAAGARFVRWMGACEAAGTAPTCRLKAFGSVTVSATFDGPGAEDPVAAMAEPPSPSAAGEPERTTVDGQAAGTAKAAPGRAKAGPGRVGQRPGRCRVNDAGCAIAAVLSNAVAEVRRVLPVLPAIGAGAPGRSGH